MARICQGSKTPKSGKGGFGVKKPPFPPTPEKGVSSQKSPFLFRAPPGRWRFFDLGRPFLGWGGDGGFLAPKPPFPDFGVFDPCKGQTDSQT